MPITFEIIHTCVQNATLNEVPSKSHKYFVCVSHICFFTSMTPEVFLFFFFFFFLQKLIKFLLQFINLLHLVDIFVLTH